MLSWDPLLRLYDSGPTGLDGVGDCGPDLRRGRGSLRSGSRGGPDLRRGRASGGDGRESRVLRPRRLGDRLENSERTPRDASNRRVE